MNARRIASDADLAGVTATLAAAFGTDPIWSWAFPEPGRLAAWWRFVVASASRYPWIWTTDDHAAAAVWIPPGGTELSPEDEARAVPLVAELAGDRARAVLELLGRFEAAHPQDRPHFYLSLLGVDPARRGHGLGMALLADTLRLVDAAGMPAYLESSNPANDVRYAGVGFVPAGSFTTPDGRHAVTTMWREPPGVARAAGPG